jgi:hypothetical protein
MIITMIKNTTLAIIPFEVRNPVSFVATSAGDEN